jgi:hypothetical protein
VKLLEHILCIVHCVHCKDAEEIAEVELRLKHMTASRPKLSSFGR